MKMAATCEVAAISLNGAFPKALASFRPYYTHCVEMIEYSDLNIYRMGWAFGPCFQIQR